MAEPVAVAEVPDAMHVALEAITSQVLAGECATLIVISLRHDGTLETAFVGDTDELPSMLEQADADIARQVERFETRHDAPARMH